MLPTRLTRGVQNLHRLQHIARVLTQHGFGHVVDQLDLGRLVPLWLRRRVEAPPEEPLGSSMGRRLRQVANDLGPIFVKLGQMLATRPDVVPADILIELRGLQDQAEPFDSAVAKQIIADELKVPIEEAFASMDDQPIASGSIGQVYRATLPDHRRVVIKVRRPDIERVVRADMALLRWLAESLESWVPETRIYHPSTLVEEFERTLIRELDYMHEAASTARLREFFLDDKDVEIPEVIWSHTSSAVLTLESLEGENLQTAIASNGERFDRKKLAIRLADVFLRQFFEIGTFHADPHPGNILIKPPARVGLIDFGQIGIIGDELGGHLLILLLGTVNRDMELIVEALLEMGAASQATDRAQLARDLQSLVDKYHGQPIKRLRVGTMYGEAAETIRRHDVALPRDVVLLLKSLTTVWGAALQLDPDLDLVALLKPRLTNMIRTRLSAKRALRIGGTTAWHLASFLRSAPQQLREVLRQVSSGKWQLNIRHENLETLGRDVDRSSNRLSFSIVIAGVVIGSSMVVSADPQIHVFGIRLQTLGIGGYLVAGILGLGLLWAIFRSGRLS